MGNAEGKFSRLEHAMTIAGARQVERGERLVCIDCGRGIGHPRQFIGEREAPVCISCVDESFKGKRHGY